MPKWKDISKLSPEEEKNREAAFEAALLAQLAEEAKPGEKPVRPSVPMEPAPTPPPAATPTAPIAARPSEKPTPIATAIAAEFESAYIAITANGKTYTFSTLAEVPLELRQKIVNFWLATPP